MSNIQDETNRIWAQIEGASPLFDIYGYWPTLHDATVEHIAEGEALGIRFAEFPTTVAAAAAAHEKGIHVLMGAPNIVRGGSHSGNIAAVDLAREGLLDILSSDYIPSSC